MPTKNRTGNHSPQTVVRKRTTTTTKAIAAIPDPAAAAARMVELLNELEAIIPDLTQPDIAKIPRVAQSAKFGRALIPPMINAVKSYPPFQQRNMFDSAAAQAALDYHGQMQPITKRMAAITMAISYSINQKLSPSGEQALQLLQWGKRHVKQPEGGGARIYVDEMQSVVDRTMNRRKPRKPATNPPTTPPSNTPPTTPTMQGFMAPSLAAKARAKAQINPDIDLDDDQILDILHKIATDPKK
jgi:hypothetical protein